MTKKEIYRMRELVEGMIHNKQADTSPSEIHDKFCLLGDEAIAICNKSINKMRPL